MTSVASRHRTPDVALVRRPARVRVPWLLALLALLALAMLASVAFALITAGG